MFYNLLGRTDLLTLPFDQNNTAIILEIPFQTHCTVLYSLVNQGLCIHAFEHRHSKQCVDSTLSFSHSYLWMEVRKLVSFIDLHKKIICIQLLGCIDSNVISRNNPFCLYVGSHCHSDVKNINLHFPCFQTLTYKCKLTYSTCITLNGFLSGHPIKMPHPTVPIDILPRNLKTCDF